METDFIEEDKYLVLKQGHEVHIVPAFVFPKHLVHDLTKTCWCHPKLDHVDDDSNNECWLHSQVN